MVERIAHRCCRARGLGPRVRAVDARDGERDEAVESEAKVGELLPLRLVDRLALNEPEVVCLLLERLLAVAEHVVDARGERLGERDPLAVGGVGALANRPDRDEAEQEEDQAQAQGDARDDPAAERERSKGDSHLRASSPDILPARFWTQDRWNGSRSSQR
jgi:hypothetical protein